MEQETRNMNWNFLKKLSVQEKHIGIQALMVRQASQERYYKGSFLLKAPKNSHVNEEDFH